MDCETSSPLQMKNEKADQNYKREINLEINYYFIKK